MTSFNALVRENIEPLVIERGFSPIEVSENSLEYGLGDLHIKCFYYPREESSNLFFWRTGQATVMFGDDTLLDVFDSHVSLIGQTPEVFVMNLRTFLLNEGSSLLSGDPAVVGRLEEYSHQQNLEYTRRISSPRDPDGVKN